MPPTEPAGTYCVFNGQLLSPTIANVTLGMTESLFMDDLEAIAFPKPRNVVSVSKLLYCS